MQPECASVGSLHIVLAIISSTFFILQAPILADSYLWLATATFMIAMKNTNMTRF